MKLITSEVQFKKWLTARNLLWEEEWENLYLPGTRTEIHDRFWTLPTSSQQRVKILEALLKNLDSWKYVILIKRYANPWYYRGKVQNITREVQNKVTSTSGIPKSYAGPVKLMRSEINILLTILFNQSLFGCSGWDDVFVIPDHGNQILMYSHHNVVWSVFRDRSQISSYVKTMKKGGFALPDCVPDSTFRTPKWMKGKAK